MFRSVNNISARLEEYLKTSQRKTYFIAFATLLFVIIITLTGILPAFSALSFQSEENTRRQEAINKINSKLDDSKMLTTEYNQNSDKVAYFKMIFPNDLDQQYLITKIDNIVTKNSSYLAAINFSDQPSNNFLKDEISADVGSLTISIFMEGKIADLQNILKEIEESRRIFNVVNVFFDKKDIQQQQQEAFQRGDSVLNIQAEIYYYKSTLVN